MGATTDSMRPEIFDKEIVDFSIDSRTTKAGELFFALSQPDYDRAGFNGTFADAHNFIAQAFANGAIAAVALSERVAGNRSEEHTSELQSQSNLVCRLLLEKKKRKISSSSRPVT